MVIGFQERAVPSRFDDDDALDDTGRHGRHLEVATSTHAHPKGRFV